jgi:hypothetical protein
MNTGSLRIRLYPLKKAALDAAKLFQPRLPKRAADPFPTHLPVLYGIARLFEIRTVLELGAGEHSTLTFLNRRVFRAVEEVRSLETDPDWMNRVVALSTGDPRLNLSLTETTISEAVASIDISGYDLIFVDDSLESTARAATIQKIAAGCSRSALVVIHDFEVPVYRSAARAFSNRYTFTALNPCTGVASHQASVQAYRLKKLNEVIRRHAESIEPSDQDGWSSALDDSVGWLRM